MDSGRHKLSENIWFVWSKMSYRHIDDGRKDDDGNVNIELESAKQDSQFNFFGSPILCALFFNLMVDCNATNMTLTAIISLLRGFHHLQNSSCEMIVLASDDTPGYMFPNCNR